MKDNVDSPTSFLEDDEYEIEDILKVKRNKKDFYFFIKWKGYGLDECTWEPEKNLTNVTFLKKKINQLKKSLEMDPESKSNGNKNVEKLSALHQSKDGKERAAKLAKLSKEMQELQNVQSEIKNDSTLSKNSKRKRQVKETTEVEEENKERKTSLRSHTEKNEKPNNVSQRNKVSDRSKKINKKINESNQHSRNTKSRNSLSTGMDDNVNDSIDVSVNDEDKEETINGDYLFVEDVFSIRIKNNTAQFLASIKNATPQWIEESYVKRVGHLYYKVEDFKRFINKKWSKPKDHKLVVRNLHNVGQQLFISVGHNIDKKEILSLYPSQIIQALYPQELLEFLMARLRY